MARYVRYSLFRRLLQQEQNSVEFCWHKSAITELLKGHCSVSSFEWTGRKQKLRVIVAKYLTEKSCYDIDASVKCCIMHRCSQILHNLHARCREMLSAAWRIHNSPKVKRPILRSFFSVDTYSQSFYNSGHYRLIIIIGSEQKKGIIVHWLYQCDIRLFQVDIQSVDKSRQDKIFFTLFYNKICSSAPLFLSPFTLFCSYLAV